MVLREKLMSWSLFIGPQGTAVRKGREVTGRLRIRKCITDSSYTRGDGCQLDIMVIILQ